MQEVCRLSFCTYYILKRKFTQKILAEINILVTGNTVIDALQESVQTE